LLKKEQISDSEIDYLMMKLHYSQDINFSNGGDAA